MGHWRPLPGLNATTNALSARNRGGIAARDIDDAARMFAGDSTKLYQLKAGAWTNFSKSGGYGPANENTRWNFTVYGDRLVATNNIDAPQYIDMSTAATAFADLAGSPPLAAYGASYIEFVFLASSTVLSWSGFGDSEGWTPGTNQSDEQEFVDGGRITGLAATKAALYVFQEKCIRRVLYVGGDTIMQIDVLVEGTGCIEPYSLVQFGQLFFYLSEDGWYQWDGVNQPTPIGLEKFDRWFLNNSNRSYWLYMSTAIDPKNKIFACGFCSANGGTTPDTILFFDYALGEPSYVQMAHEVLIPAIATFTSIDDLVGNVDTDYSISFDDPFYQGGAFYFAAFDTTHKLASFSGANVEATLQTVPQPLFDGQCASVPWIKPMADCVDATVAGGSTMRAGDAVVFQAQQAQKPSGRCPQRDVNGFYLAAKSIIPAGAVWTYASGIEWDARQAGNR